MKTDREYCMSSYLMYRTIVDREMQFAPDVLPHIAVVSRENCTPVADSTELERHLKAETERAVREGRAALALSGGIDSAILAKFMPRGSVAYTFKCVVPNVQVADETDAAARYARECGLEQRVVEIYWEDFERYAPVLMKHKGAPIHSIEVQIYKAALQAKADGFDTLVFGETADANYGGMSGLLSQERTFGEFVDRYCYLLPYKVLKEPRLILDPIERHTVDGMADTHEFLRDVYFQESINSYINACECAGVKFAAPYSTSFMSVPLDIERVRGGENKYLVREVFERLYADFEVPPKLPMPRATNEWFRDWKGPERAEFRENCTLNMTGDEKWLVYCLEKFLDLLDAGELKNNG